MIFEVDDLEFESSSDLTEEQIDEILESGDPEAINSFLEGGQKSEEEPGPLEEKLDEVEGESSDAKEEEEKPTVKDDEPNDEAIDRVVKTKDGKHEIPYEVLETARAKLKEAEDRLREQSNALSEFDQVKKLNDHLKQQLESNNIKPKDLPENFNFSKEVLAELDELGAAGDVMKALIAQNQRLSDQVREKFEAQPQANSEPVDLQSEVDSAIERNVDLSAWAKGDPDRWEFAITVDEKLRADPAFKDKTFDDRFAEVARRTKAAFGDAIENPKLGSNTKEQAEKKIAEAEQRQIPQSLTDLGQAPSTEKSLIEQLGELSEDELVSRLSGMPADQVDALLSKLG